MSGVGTRASRLARAQTALMLARLRELEPGRRWVEVLISTSGDQEAGASLGTGVFVKEIEQALLEGAIDVAVHSLKDLPTDPTPGLVVAAIPERADPRDALIGGRLADLAAGSRVGTGSPRRASQLRRLRPGVDVVGVRGNLTTRIDKTRRGDLDAVMVAAAGLERVGIPADDLLDPSEILPAPGQGALALQTREGDPMVGVIAALDDAATRWAVTAERAVLHGLGGGCLLPVGTYARVVDQSLVVEAAVTSEDGSRQVRARAEGAPGAAVSLGDEVAARLRDLGALELLESDERARQA